MKAILVSSSFPQSAEDYGGRFIAQAATDLSQRGWQIRVLGPPGEWAPHGIERLSYSSPGGLLDGTGAPDALQSQPIGGWASAAATTACALASGLRASRPDELIIGHWLVPGGLVAVAMGKKTGAPVHLYAHGSDVGLLETLPLGRTLARTLADGAQGITFVSEDLCQRFAALVGRPTRAHYSVAAMGITQAKADSTFMEGLKAQTDNRTVVTTLGRMVPIKGLRTLVDAMTDLDNLVWLALGDGPERPELMDLCAQREITMISPGVVNEAQREACLAQSHIFAQPSIELGARKEGTPVAILEAMAAGVPCVASATGGITDLAHESELRLVEPGDINGLRCALMGLRDNEEERVRIAARHRAFASRYLWSEWGQVHEKHLRNSVI
ncbi:MAG: glycosyltransferase, partial [Roseibacillus sp.]|nr:glycosyltransferase [Roseibacillus sp.]